MTNRLDQSPDPVVARLLPYLREATAAQRPIEAVYPAIEAEISTLLDYGTAHKIDIAGRELLVVALQGTSRRPLIAAALNGFRDLPKQ